jgi:hypothetical protein
MMASPDPADNMKSLTQVMTMTIIMNNPKTDMEKTQAHGVPLQEKILMSAQHATGIMIVKKNQVADIIEAMTLRSNQAEDTTKTVIRKAAMITITKNLLSSTSLTRKKRKQDLTSMSFHQMSAVKTQTALATL